jgi:hypothetical protein
VKALAEILVGIGAAALIVAITKPFGFFPSASWWVVVALLLVGCTGWFLKFAAKEK